MGKTLIVAEKPSLAKNVANSIHGENFAYHKDGYFESDNYVVVSAFGHLFGLVDMDSYLPPMPEGKRRSWVIDDLPFYPQNDEFRFELKKDPKTKKVDAGVKERFELIKKLLARADVTSVLHCCDADREGEVIGRLILSNAHNNKTVYRLWLPEQTEDVINEQLQSMKPDTEYDELYNEGICRTYMDWLYGINFTRYLSIKSGKLLRSGRVICAIVKAIYDRDMEILNFKPVPYFVATSKEKTNGCEIFLTSKKQFDETHKSDADALCKKYNAAGGQVTNIKTQKAVIDAGKLYSLSTLQSEMGKRYKMTPAQTLATVQKLYEAGYVTYPRTNSQYLGPTEAGRIDGVLKTLSGQGYKVVQKLGKKSIYDASKIESHSALTPTYKLPSSLSGDESNVYNAIRDRFVAVFCSVPCEVNRTIITIQVADEEFNIKGDVYLQKGWKEYENVHSNDTVLPNLKTGDSVVIDFKTIEKQTTPPDHYTVDTLGKYMKNPFHDEMVAAKAAAAAQDEEEDENTQDDSADYKAIFDGLEIGTEATRAGIIDNACVSNYIQLKNNVYTILPDGEFLMDTLNKLQIDLSKNATARLGKTLKAVYRGEMNVKDGVEVARQEINKAFLNKDVAIAHVAHLPGGGTPIAKCPFCGGTVIETPKAFGCTTKGCKFVLWKDNKFFDAIGKKMTKQIALEFAKNKYAALDGCTSKTGKKYNCFIILDNSGERLKMKMSFSDPSPKTGNPVGKCPICGKNMYETSRGFVCEDDSCGTALWKKSSYFKQILVIDRNKAEKLLSGKHEEFPLISKTGKKYNGYMKLSANGKYLNFMPDGFPESKK